MKTIAFFDFDGTVTKKDSFLDFIRYDKGFLVFILGFIYLFPMLVLYKLKLISNYKAKERVLTYFFAGMNEKTFIKSAHDYSLCNIDAILKPKALKKLKWHYEREHKVVIVSASIEHWLEVWCNKNNIQLIATKLEVINGTITGKLLSKNCYGIEKANRINEVYNLQLFDHIYAYGDSRGDKEMLELADNDKRFYRCF